MRKWSGLAAVAAGYLVLVFAIGSSVSVFAGEHHADAGKSPQKPPTVEEQILAPETMCAGNAEARAAGGDVIQAMKNLEYGQEEIDEVVCTLVALRSQVVLEDETEKAAVTD